VTGKLFMHAFFSGCIQLYMRLPTLGVIVDNISSAPLEWNCDPFAIPYIYIYMYMFQEILMSDVCISGRKIKQDK
jgi:hypothetical protein